MRTKLHYLYCCGGVMVRIRVCISTICFVRSPLQSGSDGAALAIAHLIGRPRAQVAALRHVLHLALVLRGAHREATAED